jgi:3-deoxy-manno-octulosonate cytidylyltransferase (CMP-KDO synthetase)
MTTNQGVIIIPARFGSTRFQGKPLHPILGVSMLERTYHVAKVASLAIDGCQVFIATDDDRIKAHAERFGAKVIMTDEQCLTGSDRAFQAASRLEVQPSYVINLQGDAPLTPPHFIEMMLKALINNPEMDVVTPVTTLSWQALDALREQKTLTPFSGTTVITNARNQALWFSKNIIPAIRKEERLRALSEQSPVKRHIGLYGFRYKALKTFVSLPAGHYEELEGLEQLRLLEHDLVIQTVEVNYQGLPEMSGIDTLEDAKRAEALLSAYEAKRG